MLLEFRVKNFLSFQDEVKLSLIASKDDIYPENTFPSGLPGINLLKSAAIYGANASGKSNLIKALSFMRQFVVTSSTVFQPGETIPVTPYKLDPKTARQPSEFEVTLAIGDRRFVYGFSLNHEKVYEEWLTLSKKKPTLLFHRIGNEIEFGRAFEGEKKKIQKLLRENALFLSVASQFNNPQASIIHIWFFYLLHVLEAKSFIQVEAITNKDTEFIRYLSDFMRTADFGIEKVDLDLKSHETALILRTIRRSSDGSPVAFTLESDEESAGTRRLAKLAEYLYQPEHAIMPMQIYVIDELDSKLHPLLTRYLVEKIHASPTTQFVFTTHDSTLLDPDLFRRDQIWFTEKARSGATDLYSLYDMRGIRKDEDFGANYLKGRYGAIPFIGDFKFDEIKK
jgi:uncharacterized protein